MLKLRTYSFIALLLTVVLAMFYTPTASAKGVIYKCVDTAGKISYGASPCAVDLTLVKAGITTPKPLHIQESPYWAKMKAAEIDYRLSTALIPLTINLALDRDNYSGQYSRCCQPQPNYYQGAGLNMHRPNWKQLRTSFNSGHIRDSRQLRCRQELT